ncbi:hypothetical protein BD413DRAFT_202365 [Trametes elegans]|nr:hypothetical protein BD413DRAFT_202365 [Trametes elegans]
MDFSWSQPRASSSSAAPSATRQETEMRAFRGHGQNVPLASLESMYHQMDPIDALLPSAWEHAPAPDHGLSAHSPGPSLGAWGVGPADMSPSSFVQLQGAGPSAPSLRGGAGAFMGVPDAPQGGASTSASASASAPFMIDFAALGAGMGLGLPDGGGDADSLALADGAIADETLNVWSEAPNSMGCVQRAGGEMRARSAAHRDEQELTSACTAVSI